MGKTPLLTAPQPRLQIEEVPKEMMCSFHMTSDHDEPECPDWLNCLQLANNALIEEQMIEKEDTEKGESGTYFLEYESDSERGGDIYTTLQEPACTVMT